MEVYFDIDKWGEAVVRTEYWQSPDVWVRIEKGEYTGLGIQNGAVTPAYMHMLYLLVRKCSELERSVTREEFVALLAEVDAEWGEDSIVLLED